MRPNVESPSVRQHRSESLKSLREIHARDKSLPFFSLSLTAPALFSRYSSLVRRVGLFLCR